MSAIDRVRSEFLTEAENHSDLYHQNDVQMVKSNDWTVERFIIGKKTEDLALKALIKAMQWRKSFGVNQFNDQYFPQEVYKIGIYTNYCNDKDGRPIIWYKGSAYHKSSEMNQLLKQFVVYQMEKLDRQTSNEGWGYVIDNTGMGLSNVDLDYTSFISTALSEYFPKGCKYMASVDLPWILNATSKIVLKLMSEEIRSTVKFINKQELTQYLDIDSIPVHLNGKNTKSLIQIPDQVLPLTKAKHLNLTDKQIEKIYSTFKNELK